MSAGGFPDLVKLLINLLRNSTSAWSVGTPNPFPFLGAPGSASSWRFLPPPSLLYLTAVPPDVEEGGFVYE